MTSFSRTLLKPSFSPSFQIQFLSRSVDETSLHKRRHIAVELPLINMIRRQAVLIVVCTVIFQTFFSTSNILPSNEPNADGLLPTTTTPPLSAANANNNCESTSIGEFPPLLFNNEQLRRGGILLHIVLILYSFAAIEIVCDDYFASALERISCNFNLTPVRSRKRSDFSH